MSDILDEIEVAETLTDRDIFTQIWTAPKKVFRYLNDTQYDKQVVILLSLAGISNAFDRAIFKNMGDLMSLGVILGVCILLGGTLGRVWFHIYAALIHWTGNWLNGQGETKDILRMTAYAMIPSIVTLPFLFLQILAFGNEVFKKNGDLTSMGPVFENIFVYGTLFGDGIFGIWTIVFLVIGIAEVQNFSIGKAILNFLLPILVLVLPLAMLFFWLKGF
jgi:hypothetical protein